MSISFTEFTSGSLPSWVATPFIVRLFEVLGGDQEVRFVGGCVRDSLLGYDTQDIDLACCWEPDVVMSKLVAAGIKVVASGVEHGTVTAILHNQSIEITTLRRDVATDGRRAVTAWTKDWAEDAMRRDFTINALYMDLSGQIYDPTGQGLADLKAQHVRFIGEARARIAEDYLRILRYFRFYARFNDGGPDADALIACEEAADKLSELSKERVSMELLKILQTDRVPEVLDLMKQSKVLDGLIDVDHQAFRRLVVAPAFFGGREDVLARLYVCAGCNLDRLRPFLVLSNSDWRFLETLSRVQQGALDYAHDIQVALYYHGRAVVYYSYLIAQPSVNGVMLDVIQDWDIPVFPIKGADLMAEGYQPGPALGAELARREQQWIENGFSF